MYDEQKPHEDEIASELLALERQLRGMTPIAARVDRDQLMFAAGQAAGIASVAEPGHDSRAMYDRADRPMYIAGPSWPGRHFWPAATFTMTAATLLLATMLVWQDRRQPIAERLVPRQPAVIAINDSQDFETRGLVRLDARNLWPPLPSTNSGYLGVRYVALTRGVG